MFDFSQSIVKPWPVQLPFGSRNTTLTDVRWSAERVCELTIEHQPLGHELDRWCFRAIAPLDVIVQEDEGQVVSLWLRRTACCPGESGFLVVEDSPIIRAITRTEPQVELRMAPMRHFVLGTDWGVAHIICEETPSLERAA